MDSNAKINLDIVTWRLLCYAMLCMACRQIQGMKPNCRCHWCWPGWLHRWACEVWLFEMVNCELYAFMILEFGQAAVFQRRAAGSSVIDCAKNMFNCWSSFSNAANCRCYQGSTIGLEDCLHWQVSRLWKWWAGCAKPEEFFTKLLPRRGPPGGTCLNVRGWAHMADIAPLNFTNRSWKLRMRLEKFGRGAELLLESSDILTKFPLSVVFSRDHLRPFPEVGCIPSKVHQWETKEWVESRLYRIIPWA